MKLDWKEHIIVDEKIAFGKPVISGTRLTVEFIFGLLASGWSSKEILKNYPKLKDKDIQAVFAFAFEAMKDGFMFKNPGISR